VVPTLNASDQDFCEQQADDDGLGAVRSDLAELTREWDGRFPTVMWKQGFEKALDETAEFLTAEREAGLDDEELRTGVRSLRNAVAGAQTAVAGDSSQVSGELYGSLRDLTDYCVAHG